MDKYGGEHCDHPSDRIWRSAEGPILLKDMGDGHIANAIAMVQRKVKEMEVVVKKIGAELVAEPLGLPDVMVQLLQISRDVKLYVDWIGYFREEIEARKQRASKGKSRREVVIGKKAGPGRSPSSMKKSRQYRLGLTESFLSS